MKWANFIYNEIEYDLSHLHSFEWHYTAEAGEKRPERTYRFHVVFGIHCFSRDPLPGETVEPELFYHGKKESRVFCFDRHEYSLSLPDIIKSMQKTVKKENQTGKIN